MKTTTFVTSYEGPRKIHTITEDFLVGILSSLGTNVSQEKCDLIAANIIKAVKETQNNVDVFELKNIIESYASGLDAAFAYRKEGDVIFVTQGTGIVFVKRGDKVRQVASDGQAAKGNIKDKDEYITTISEYLDFVGGLDGFNYYFGRYKAFEVSEMMETYEDQSSPSGFVAMYIGKNEEDEEENIENSLQSLSQEASLADPSENISVEETIHEEPQTDGELIEEKIKIEKLPRIGILANAMILIKNIKKRENVHKIKFIAKKIISVLLSLKTLGPKKLAALLVFMISLFLVFRSIPYDQLFKNRDEEFSKIEGKVNAYLSEAETHVYGDTTEISIVLQKARDEIEVLSDADKKYFSSKLEKLQKKIDDKEKEFLKISSTLLEKYYDLSLIGKNINVTDVDNDGENIYILDSVQGAYYIIPVGNISQKVIKSDKIKNSLEIAAYEGRVYVLTKNDGIYKIDDQKSTQVLKAENSWGEIVDMKIYASNIYLLDTEKGDIYKYPGIDENTFGTEVPYLVEELRGTLQGAQDIVITGPVFVIGKSQVAKYLTGNRVDFVMKLPYKDAVISSFAATTGTEYYFIYDSEYKALYIYGEDGIMQKQHKDDSVKNIVALTAGEAKAFAITDKLIFNLPVK